MALNKKITFIWTLFSIFGSCNLLCWLYIYLITLSGYFELNFRPKCKAAQTFSICHWNLNSICAHHFAKLSLLIAYASVHKSDIICLSETYLDSSIDDESLEISEYYLIRSDHPSNKKCDGICIYYKNVLPLKVTDICLLDERITFNLVLVSKKKAFLLVLLNDFNAKLRQWHDKDSSTSEGISIENIMLHITSDN